MSRKGQSIERERKLQVAHSCGAAGNRESLLMGARDLSGMIEMF